MFARWFPKGSTRHIVAENTASQLVGRIVSTLAMTVVSLLIARRFGSDGYGDFVKITTYVGFFYLFADFGLNAAYVQGAIERPLGTGGTKSWQQLFGLRLIMSLLLVAAAFGVLSIFPQNTAQGYTTLVRWGILFLSPAIIFQATTTTTNAFFQKALRYDLATVAQNAGSVVMLVIALFFAYGTAMSGPYIGVLSIGIGSVVTAILALYFIRKYHGAILPLFHIRTMILDFKKTLPLGLTLIFNLIYFHSDSVVLTLSRSTHEVGIYGLAYKVFELPLVFPLFFINAVYPLLLKANKERPESSPEIFWQSLWLLLGSSFVIGAGLWGAAPLVTYIRPDFAESILPLRILLLSLPVFFVSALLMWVLIAQNQKWRLLAIHTVAMIGNLALNIVFIPRYGYVAAAWITGMSEAFILILSSFFVMKSLKKKGAALV